MEPEDEVLAPEAEQEDQLDPNVEQEDEIVVQIGDEEPEAAEEEPGLVNKLRRLHREERKAREELEAKLAEHVKKPDALGPKPTLEACDYDAAVFEEQLDTWKEAKRAKEAEEAEAVKAQQTHAERWQAKVANYEETKAGIKAADREEAIDLVKETFSVVQQGIVIQGAENPGLLAYALGKNPKRARELAEIHDPIEFAFAIAKTEAQLKVGKKSDRPAPESAIRTGGGTNAALDSALERARAKAMQTGDFSEVVKLKAQKRAKEAAK